MKRLSGPRWERAALIIAVGILGAHAPGCVVSFSGYELDQGDAAAGAGGSGVGASGAAGTTVSSGAAGVGQGGSGGSGQSGTGGTTTMGSGGTAQGGTAGLGQGGGAGQGGTGPIDGGGGRGGSGAGGGPGGSAGKSDAGVDAGPGGTGGSSVSDASTDTGPVGCPPLAGPPLVEVPIPMGASGAPGTYCVDRTEVTNAQYAAFLATNPSTGTQPAFCSWNTSFQPQNSGSDCLNASLVFDVMNLPASPVACVDWCDAFAYCRSVGKRLCGAFGGGSVAVASGADATRDEWYSACSKAGTQKFPYGNAYDSAACNMDTYKGGQSTSVTVADATRCVGGYPTLHDMNGNVGEWEDSCTGTTGDTDMCSTRGGDYLSFDSTDPAKAGNCLVTPKSVRSRRSSRVGFRCCYDGK